MLPAAARIAVADVGALARAWRRSLAIAVDQSAGPWLPDGLPRRDRVVVAANARDDPDALRHRRYYQPSERGHERLIKERMTQQTERRAQDEALLRKTQVAAGGAHDAPDEEVEQDEKRDLERQ